jgi:adenylate kinase family enzyme
MNPKKIHIIGGCGSGKSYISKKLSKKLNIPYFDLDDVFWDNKQRTMGIERNPAKRNKKLLNIINKKKWIIEGIFISFTKPSFKKADLIVVLKPSTFTLIFRITKRFIKRKLGIEHSKKKETLKEFTKLLKFTKIYYKTKFKETLEILKPYQNKTIIITKSNFTKKDIIKIKQNNLQPSYLQ